MPETTVYKDHRFVFEQYDIQFTGKVFHMKAVTEALGKEEPAHQHFRQGVGATDAAPIVAASCAVVYIGYAQK